MFKNHLVTQSNHLIEARHAQSLTVREQKIVLTFVSMIQPSDEDFKVYSLSIKDFHKLVELKGREHYTQIKSIIRKLMTRTIEIPKEDGGYLITHWATHVEYISGKGIIQFSFEPKLKPYLLQLKRTFTSYRLSNILSLGSYYAIRIYELLKKWETAGKWRTSVEHLKNLLGITQKSYKLYGNLKNRVIKPSIEELNNKTDINVTYEEIKEGRSVVSLVFYIKQIKKPLFEMENVLYKKNESEVEVASLFDRMNKSAMNFEIDLNVYTNLYSIASNIYEQSKIEEELLGLVAFTNNNASKNPIGFMIHILKSKEKTHSNGGNPSIIEGELKSSFQSSKDIIPDWFSNNKTDDECKEQPLDEKELEEMAEIISRHSTTI